MLSKHISNNNIVVSTMVHYLSSNWFRSILTMIMLDKLGLVLFWLYWLSDSHKKHARGIFLQKHTFVKQWTCLPASNSNDNIAYTFSTMVIRFLCIYILNDNTITLKRTLPRLLEFKNGRAYLITNSIQIADNVIATDKPDAYFNMLANN